MIGSLVGLHTHRNISGCPWSSQDSLGLGLVGLPTYRGCPNSSQDSLGQGLVELPTYRDIPGCPQSSQESLGLGHWDQ